MNVTKSIIIMAVATGIVSWVSYSFYQAYQPKPIRLQGQIEAQQYSISSKVAGRIDKVMVKKGDSISIGDPVFTIYSPEIEAKLDQALAGQKAAGAIALQVENGARSQQIMASKDQWNKARSAASLAEKTFQRVDNLYEDGVVAEQKRDEAFTQWQAAKYTQSAAYQMYEMAKEGARNETKQAAIEKERMAAGAVAEVKAYQQDTRIHSWFNGEVSQVLLNSGELAPMGFPVVTVIDMNDSWVVLNIREDRLKHFKKGSLFKGYLPAIDKNIEFKVTHISVMGNFATWRSTDASQGFDLRTFEVEARPVESANELRMGMSVSVMLAAEK